MPHASSGSIYRRLYLSSLALCFLTVLIVFAAITTGRHGEWRETMRRFSRTVAMTAAARLGPHLEDGQLPGVLDDLASRFDTNATLLDATGKRIASVGAELTEPTTEELEDASGNGFATPHRKHPFAHSLYEAIEAFRGTSNRDRWSMIPLEQDGKRIGYLQFSPAHRAETQAKLRLALTLAAILLVVATVIIPATRSVTGPLIRLAESARKFGAGDFTHRAPVDGPREVARVGVEMNEMAQRISTLLHTQRQLLADVSHELRSPLARIEVALELARSGGAPIAPLESIASDAAELRQLIQDILTNSRLELRPDLVKREVVPASELLSESRGLAVAAGMVGERVTIRDETAGLSVRVDADLIAHAMSNLLDNARKHTPPETPIVVGGRRQGERLLLYVEDRGPGLAPEELPRLFEPFYRPDADRGRAKGGGAGLGLSLVRRIAELHGAAPFVTSQVGQGSTFGITVEVV